MSARMVECAVTIWACRNIEFTINNDFMISSLIKELNYRSTFFLKINFVNSLMISLQTTQAAKAPPISHWAQNPIGIADSITV